jgi:RluA family pseudouridine synthase
MLKTRSVKIQEHLDGQRIDLVAATLFENLSRKKIKSIIDFGGAYLNKKRVKFAKNLVRGGDLLEIFWEEDKSGVALVGNFRNSVNKDTLIFENEDFFIINKPSGIPSQATLSSCHHHILKSLHDFDALKFQLKKMFLVHRLDKETSGLMILAKTKEIQKKIEELFKMRKIEKSYSCLCFFTPEKLEGRILFPIAKERSRRNCYSAITEKKFSKLHAKEAETIYCVKKVYKNREASFITCFPKTGRTHQIRVHLATLGCPILGDKLYSQNIIGHRYSQIALRQMLHASTLSFELKGKKFNFSSTLPEDFAQILDLLDKGEKN